jgi:hypothetical protein
MPNLQPPKPITSDADLNIDLSRGPLSAFQNIFPDSNFFDTSNNLLGDPAQNIGQVSGSSEIPYLPMSNPFASQEPLPETSEAPQLSWEEWDQVMRDFQMDVEKDDSNPTKGTNVTEWFACSSGLPSCAPCPVLCVIMI